MFHAINKLFLTLMVAL